MVGIVKNHLMMFTRNLVGIPMGFGFQNEVTNPTDKLLKLIVPAYITRKDKHTVRNFIMSRITYLNKNTQTRHSESNIKCIV